MTGLAALVACLASGAERTSVGSGAVSRDVAKLATSVALHGLRLAVTSEVVGTTALVARSRARTTTISAAAVTTKATTANWTSTTHTNAGRVGARTLLNKVRRRYRCGWKDVYLQPGGQAAHSCNTDRHRHRSASGLGSRPVRGPVLDSGSTAWPQSSEGEGTGSTRVLAACSCSKGVQPMSKLRHSGRRCHICSRHGERATTS